MIPALILMILGGAFGWYRAARRGGATGDKLQYAAAHGLPAFLVGMIAMTMLARMGILG